MSGRTIFAQLMEFLPVYEFNKCVQRYDGDHRVRSFSCFDQFLSMAFAQLTHRESLRDLETCFRVAHKKLYLSGIRGQVSRSTLADANESRDWRIYADFGQVLIARARHLHSNEEWGANLKVTAYALDSTTIDLCLELFPWAKLRRTKAAVKMHIVIDLRGNVPSFIRITNGKVHDVNFLDDVMPEAGAFYIMDRVYNDFERLKRFDTQGAFFVVRSKNGMCFRRTTSREVDKSTGVRCDQSIVLTGVKTKGVYTDELRRISFYDEENSRRLVFVTKNLRLAPTTIAKLYKCRWKVELFLNGSSNTYELRLFMAHQRML